MSYKKVYKDWLNNDYFDQDFIDELKSIEHNEQQIEERFYKDLAFGTGGMRGIIGAGRNRINKYVIRKATQGFANFINKRFSEDKSIVIAYDSRFKSDVFALEAALVMAGNGIKAYLFESLRSTPELSYAVRALNAKAGIVVTASHNPPEYNGYKIYGEDGAQYVPKYANQVIQEVNLVSDFNAIKRLDKNEALDQQLLEIISDEIDERYIESVVSKGINKEILSESDFKVVYTPLHGTGAMPVERVLKARGLKNFYPVEEQMKADSSFSTVEYPNPEEVDAFELGIKLAKEKNAQLIVATDPDCDRVGLMVKDKQGQYKALNGNQAGALLLDYILSQLDELPDNSVMINTIVTSGMGEAIADLYDVQTMTTLTGFKFIGEKIKEFEKTDENFIFGYEESYGYLYGTDVRDKDAVVTTMLLIEMAAYYCQKGMNLLEVLEELYQKVGYYLEDLVAIRHEGKSGQEKIEKILKSLRNNSIDSISGVQVIKEIDCLLGKNTNLPKSNVLKYILEDGSWFAVRPSGTEPKIKLYFSARDESLEKVKDKLNRFKDEIIEKIESI